MMFHSDYCRHKNVSESREHRLLFREQPDQQQPHEQNPDQRKWVESGKNNLNSPKQKDILALIADKVQWIAQFLGQNAEKIAKLFSNAKELGQEVQEGASSTKTRAFDAVNQRSNAGKFPSDGKQTGSFAPEMTERSPKNETKKELYKVKTTEQINKMSAQELDKEFESVNQFISKDFPRILNREPKKFAGTAIGIAKIMWNMSDLDAKRNLYITQLLPRLENANAQISQYLEQSKLSSVNTGAGKFSADGKNVAKTQQGQAGKFAPGEKPQTKNDTQSQVPKRASPFGIPQGRNTTPRTPNTQRKPAGKWERNLPDPASKSGFPDKTPQQIKDAIDEADARAKGYGGNVQHYLRMQEVKEKQQLQMDAKREMRDGGINSPAIDRLHQSQGFGADVEYKQLRNYIQTLPEKNPARVKAEAFMNSSIFRSPAVWNKLPEEAKQEALASLRKLAGFSASTMENAKPVPVGFEQEEKNMQSKYQRLKDMVYCFTSEADLQHRYPNAESQYVKEVYDAYWQIRRRWVDWKALDKRNAINNLEKAFSRLGSDCAPGMAISLYGNAPLPGKSPDSNQSSTRDVKNVASSSPNVMRDVKKKNMQKLDDLSEKTTIDLIASLTNATGAEMLARAQKYTPKQAQDVVHGAVSAMYRLGSSNFSPDALKNINIFIQEYLERNDIDTGTFQNFCKNEVDLINAKTGTPMFQFDGVELKFTGSTSSNIESQKLPNPPQTQTPKNEPPVAPTPAPLASSAGLLPETNAALAKGFKTPDAGATPTTKMDRPEVAKQEPNRAVIDTDLDLATRVTIFPKAKANDAVSYNPNTDQWNTPADEKEAARMGIWVSSESRGPNSKRITVHFSNDTPMVVERSSEQGYDKVDTEEAEERWEEAEKDASGTDFVLLKHSLRSATKGPRGYNKIDEKWYLAPEGGMQYLHWFDTKTKTLYAGRPKTKEYLRYDKANRTWEPLTERQMKKIQKESEASGAVTKEVPKAPEKLEGTPISRIRKNLNDLIAVRKGKDEAAQIALVKKLFTGEFKDVFNALDEGEEGNLVASLDAAVITKEEQLTLVPELKKNFPKGYYKELMK